VGLKQYAGAAGQLHWAFPGETRPYSGAGDH